jgi:DNA-binding GntR family transcriptional regulator
LDAVQKRDKRNIVKALHQHKKRAKESLLKEIKEQDK